MKRYFRLKRCAKYYKKIKGAYQWKVVLVKEKTSFILSQNNVTVALE
jgi:hypothetical protein